MSWRLLFIFGLSSFLAMPVNGNSLPTAVQLGSAIVAAVEEDAEQEAAMEDQQLQKALGTENFWQKIYDEIDLNKMEKLFGAIEEGRGKFRKQKKLLKYLYPLLVGTLIAKTVLVPLLLKLLTALSTSSFVMSKIALLISGVLVLKWIFAVSPSDRNERNHYEIVHLPPIKALNGGVWNDLSLSGSTYVDAKTKNSRQKLIPVGSAQNIPSANNEYYYSQHNYDNSYGNQPFL